MAAKFAKMRPHCGPPRLSGFCLQDDPPAIHLDQKRVQVQRQPIRRKKGARQHLLEICLRGSAGLDLWRPPVSPSLSKVAEMASPT